MVSVTQQLLGITLPLLSLQGRDGTSLSWHAHGVNNVKLKLSLFFRPVGLTWVHEHVIRHAKCPVKSDSEHIAVKADCSKAVPGLSHQRVVELDQTFQLAFINWPVETQVNIFQNLSWQEYTAGTGKLQGPGSLRC